MRLFGRPDRGWRLAISETIRMAVPQPTADPTRRQDGSGRGVPLPISATADGARRRDEFPEGNTLRNSGSGRTMRGVFRLLAASGRVPCACYTKPAPVLSVARVALLVLQLPLRLGGGEAAAPPQTKDAVPTTWAVRFCRGNA